MIQKKQTLWKNYVLQVLAVKVINCILKLSCTRVCSTAIRGVLRRGVLSQASGPLRSPPTTFPLDFLEIPQIYCQLVVVVSVECFALVKEMVGLLVRKISELLF